MGFVILSSWPVGFVFLTDVEVDRSCEVVFVEEALNFVGLTWRERSFAVVDDDDADDDDEGFESPVRSLLLLLLLLLFVDVCE